MLCLLKTYKSVVKIQSWQWRILNLKPFEMRLELNQSAITTQVSEKYVDGFAAFVESKNLKREQMIPFLCNLSF